MSDLSASDVLAMTNARDNNGFFGGDGFYGLIVLFFIFAMFGGGGLGWGGGNAALQGALTRGDLADGFNTAAIQRNQSDIVRDQFGLQKDIFDARLANQQCCCETQQQIMQNRYDNAIGNCNLQREILDSRYTTQLGFQALQAQLSNCCCDLKTAIHAEGETTRALHTADRMQELRDNLQSAQLQLSNLSQTNTLLQSLQPTPRPAYPVASPYMVYNYAANNGCGWYNTCP